MDIKFLDILVFKNWIWTYFQFSTNKKWSGSTNRRTVSSQC